MSDGATVAPGALPRASALPIPTREKLAVLERLHANRSEYLLRRIEREPASKRRHQREIAVLGAVLAEFRNRYADEQAREGKLL